MTKKMDRSSILSILPPDQYLLKKKQLEAEFLVTSFTRIRDGVKVFANDIVFVSREFTNKIALMVCTAFIEKYYQDAPIRLEGQNIAACKIQSLYHSFKARKFFKEIMKTRERENRRNGIFKKEGIENQGAFDELKAKQKREEEEKLLRIKAQEAKLAELAAYKESIRIEMHSVEPIEDGVDIIICIDLSFTDVGATDEDKKWITPITTVIREAIYQDVKTVAVHDLFIASDHSPEKLPPLTATRPDGVIDYSKVLPSELLRIQHENATPPPMDTSGEIGVFLFDKRMGVDKSMREGQVAGIDTSLTCLGIKPKKWNRKEAEIRIERALIGLKNRALKQGKEMILLSIRGLIPGCKYVTKITLDGAFAPRDTRKASAVPVDYFGTLGAAKIKKKPNISLDAVSFTVLPAAPSAPHGVVTRLLADNTITQTSNTQNVESLFEEDDMDDHLRPSSVVDLLRNVRTCNSCIEDTPIPSPDRNIPLLSTTIPNSKVYKIEVKWEASVDNGSAIRHYIVYRSIDTKLKALNVPGVKNYDFKLEAQVEKISWKRVAKVTGLSFIDLLTEEVIFGNNSNSEHAGIQYHAIATNKYGKSITSPSSTVLRIDRILPKQRSHATIQPMNKSTNDILIDPVLSPPPHKSSILTLPQLVQHQHHSIADMSRMFCNRDVDMKESLSSDYIISSALKSPALPLQWVDNMYPYTSNKVDKSFYRAVSPPIPISSTTNPMDPNQNTHINNQTHEQNTEDINKWLNKLSLACPLKPIDTTAKELDRLMGLSKSIRVDDSNHSAINSLLGEKLRLSKTEQIKKKVQKQY